MDPRNRRNAASPRLSSAEPTQELRGPARPTPCGDAAVAPPEHPVLDDRYELRRRLGSGGMADVFLAWDRALQRDVAIKSVPVDASDPHGLDRFWREALALAAVESAHVVTVHDVYIDDASACLVMAYARGQTLDELLRDGALPPDRAVRLVGQVLEGLEALHASRIVHRDIKPANVVVDWKDHVVLVDLGVACDRRRPALTPADATFGTPGYMAPEHRESNRVDERSDLYQVGLLALFAVTGVDPADHEGGGSAGVEAALATVAPPLAEVLRQALARDPGRRFGCAGDMRGALEAAIASDPPRQGDPAPALASASSLAPTPNLARPPVHATPPSLRPGRAPLVMGVVLVLAVLLVMLLVLR
jgi:serine/threonine protein kinase